MVLRRKADISALALEATLSAMKGTGWSTESLKAIYDAIVALPFPTGYALEATLTAIKGSGWSTETLKAIYDYITMLNDISVSDVEGAVENAVDALISHDITVAHGTNETDVVEVPLTGIYAFSAYLDLDTLIDAGEGGTVTMRLYNKIDSVTYRCVAKTEFTVGTDEEHPNIEANLVRNYCKITIQLSNAVSITRAIKGRFITRDLGA